MPRSTIHILCVRIIASAIMLAGVAGCYSPTKTAKIGSGEVKREGAATTSEEQKLIAGAEPQPFVDWREGKKWIITDDKIRLALRGDLPQNSLEGDTLVFSGASESPSVTGEPVTDLSFRVMRGDSKVGEAAYRVEISPAVLASRTDAPAIPFAVELSPVETLRNRLAGKRLYVLTSVWLDSADNYIKGRHYVPVTVKDVVAGTPQAPAKIVISPDYEPSQTAFIAITLSADGAGRRDFATAFSLTDPRKRYSDIYPDVWEKITRGEVADGMSREECRLALGSPVSVTKREYYGLSREIWNYGDGTYLQFDDGVLRMHRQ